VLSVCHIYTTVDEGLRECYVIRLFVQHETG
jgi:hypothetical protein